MERLGNSRRVAIAALVIAPCALGACARGSSGTHGASQAKLTVHIGLFGGPMRPNAGMALFNSPAQGANVTAVDSRGSKHVARTDGNGMATMLLESGAYTVYSTYCGTGPHQVVLTAGQVTRVRIDCAVREGDAQDRP
jgi:hypothetical protein